MDATRPQCRLRRCLSRTGFECPYPLAKTKGPDGAFVFLAERVGFEPTVRKNRTLDFESSSFDHSDTSPHSLAGRRFYTQIQFRAHIPARFPVPEPFPAYNWQQHQCRQARFPARWPLKSIRRYSKLPRQAALLIKQLITEAKSGLESDGQPPGWTSSGTVNPFRFPL